MFTSSYKVHLRRERVTILTLPIVYYDGIKIRWLTEASINGRTISFIEKREIWSSFFKS